MKQNFEMFYRNQLHIEFLKLCHLVKAARQQFWQAAAAASSQ